MLHYISFINNTNLYLSISVIYVTVFYICIYVAIRWDNLLYNSLCRCIFDTRFCCYFNTPSYSHDTTWSIWVCIMLLTCSVSGWKLIKFDSYVITLKVLCNKYSNVLLNLICFYIWKMAFYRKKLFKCAQLSHSASKEGNYPRIKCLSSPCIIIMFIHYRSYTVYSTGIQCTRCWLGSTECQSCLWQLVNNVWCWESSHSLQNSTNCQG